VAASAAAGLPGMIELEAFRVVVFSGASLARASRSAASLA